MKTVESAIIEQYPGLDKPGAGIPWYEEKFISHIVVPLLPLVFNWESALLFLQKQIQEIVVLIEDLDEETMQKQVLVPRLFGLEDSSRFWSINMVVEHLVTVNLGTYEIVDQLNQEKSIPRELGTAKVKPFHNKSYTKNLIFFDKAYARMIKKNTNKASKARKNHPWFGALNNYNWHSFIGLHNKLHKRQIQHILKILDTKNLS